MTSEGHAYQEALRTMMDMGFDKAAAAEALELTNNDLQAATNYLFLTEDERRIVRDTSTNEDEKMAQQLDADLNETPQPQQSSQGHVPIEPGLVPNMNTLPPSYPSDQQAAPSPSGYHFTESANYDQGHFSPPTQPSRPPLPPRSSNMHIEDVENQGDYTLLGGNNAPHYSHEASRPNVVNRDYHMAHGPGVSVYETIERYARPQEKSPPILMPVRNGLYESYLNALVMALHEVPSVRNAVYHHHFRTLGFHPRWFKGELINVPHNASKVTTDKGFTHDLRFLMEVQRLFGFLEGESTRAFASTKNFIESFPRIAQQKFADVDSMSDACDAFYEILTSELLISGYADANKLFRGTLKHEDDDSADDAVDDADKDGNQADAQPEPQSEQYFGMLPIYYEDLTTDLHSTLAAMLWGDSEAERSRIKSFGDVVAIGIEQQVPSSRRSARGFHLSKKMYLDVFTCEYDPIVSQVQLEMAGYALELKDIDHQRKALKQFQGKPVPPAIASSLEYFRKELEKSEHKDPALARTYKKLLQVHEDSTKTLDKLTQRRAEVELLLETSDLLNPHALIKRKGEEMEAYILTGVIIDIQTFAYIKKVDDEYQWVLVKFDDSGNDFRVESFDFEELSEFVHDHCKGSLRQPLVLIHVRESVFLAENTDTEIPPSVTEFIKKDQEELAKTLELLDSSSDEDVEASDDVKGNGDAEVDVSLDDSSYEEIDDKQTAGAESSSADLIELDTPVESKAPTTDAEEESALELNTADVADADGDKKI